MVTPLAAPSLNRRPLIETVADEITRQILEGELRPGDKLNEVKVAGQLGVSRGPVREAARRLQEAGLLEGHAFRGSFVRKLSQREVSDIYAMQLLLESTAIAQATRLATSDDLADIESALHETETAALANAKSRMIEAEVAFHCAICKSGRNERITETFVKLATELRLVHLLMDLGPDRMRAKAQSHRSIVMQLKSRNADRAVSAIQRHIHDERDEVLQYLGPHGDSVDQPANRRSTEDDSQNLVTFNGRISIREHTPADFDLLARMNRELADDEGHRNRMSLAELQQRFERFVDEDGWSIDLFVLDEEVIGYATHRYERDETEPSGKRIRLRQFYMARHRRRGGAGRAAFEELVRSRFHAGERIYLEVIENNPGGKIFWARTGFVPFGTIMEHVVETSQERQPQ